MPHLINEIQIGTVSQFNGMTMFRKYDAQKGFKTHFKFIDDDSLSLESNIVIPYIEYFKNSDNNEVLELRRYKCYIVANIPAKYQIQSVEISPAVLYEIGEVITPAEYYPIDYIITPAVYDEDGITILTPAVISDGTQILNPAIIATGNEIKIPAVYEDQQVEISPAWNAANNWFMSVARTPITAPYGIMDSIENTLLSLPINAQNGYILQAPIQ